MKNKPLIATSTLVAAAIAMALILRPARSLSPLPALRRTARTWRGSGSPAQF
jgi:hypothetical protein